MKCNKKLIEINNERLDKHFRTELQAQNIMMIVVVNNELKYTIYTPSFMAGEIWDIGFLNSGNGEMMIMNVMRASLPENRIELCNEYFNFFGMLAKKTNLRSFLGFHREGKTKFEDTIVEAINFKRNLANLMRVEENSPIVQSVTNGISDLFGNASYKALVRLVNMNVASFSEVDYSRTAAGFLKEALSKKIDFGFLYSYPQNTQSILQTKPNQAQVKAIESKTETIAAYKKNEESKVVVNEGGVHETTEEKKIVKEEQFAVEHEEEKDQDFGDGSDDLDRENEESQKVSQESGDLSNKGQNAESPDTDAKRTNI